MITKGKWEFINGKQYTEEESDYTLGCINGGKYNLTLARINSDIMSIDDAKDNAEFIVSACNACKEINPEHPELVAQNIKEMYEQLVSIKTAFECHSLHDVELVKAVLSKIKGGE